MQKNKTKQKMSSGPVPCVDCWQVYAKVKHKDEDLIKHITELLAELGPGKHNSGIRTLSVLAIYSLKMFFLDKQTHF